MERAQYLWHCKDNIDLHNNINGNLIMDHIELLKS